MGGLLRKIEEVVTGTNNGKAPQLAGYYAYWERSMFVALNTMVLSAMRMLVTMLHARSAKKAAAAGLAARTPLFKVIVSRQPSGSSITPIAMLTCHKHSVVAETLTSRCQTCSALFAMSLLITSDHELAITWVGHCAVLQLC